ncbi:uncharacterized protein LOC114869042 [Betta splendens]|uniref:Uncharacterized protein LOC114869042 n=1 Tax=Betta splendens TaxID=158456 RepID=A0A6P7PFC3_BETSP|nr:uncharacterized protein LOC114869042 [Betta splendens]
MDPAPSWVPGVLSFIASSLLIVLFGLISYKWNQHQNKKNNQRGHITADDGDVTSAVTRNISQFIDQTDGIKQLQDEKHRNNIDQEPVETVKPNISQSESSPLSADKEELETRNLIPESEKCSNLRSNTVAAAHEPQLKVVLALHRMKKLEDEVKRIPHLEEKLQLVECDLRTVTMRLETTQTELEHKRAEMQELQAEQRRREEAERKQLEHKDKQLHGLHQHRMEVQSLTEKNKKLEKLLSEVRKNNEQELMRTNQAARETWTLTLTELKDTQIKLEAEMSTNRKLRAENEELRKQLIKLSV